MGLSAITKPFFFLSVLLSFQGAFGGNTSSFRPKEIIFTSVLNGAQEVPLCDASVGIGNALLTLNGRELCSSVSYTGLSSDELFAHIHGPAEIGETGPVIFTLSNGPNKNDCFTLSWSEKRDLLKGLWYFNVHSDMCEPGEIRGQILRA